jgi:hypothetical protein
MTPVKPTRSGKHLDNGGPLGVRQGFVQRVDKQVAPISGGPWDTMDRRRDGSFKRTGRICIRAPQRRLKARFRNISLIHGAKLLSRRTAPPRLPTRSRLRKADY